MFEAMRKINYQKLVLLALLTFITFTSFAQSKSTLIIGDWCLSKWEYPEKDTAKRINFEKDAKDKIVSFKKDNKVETTKIIAGKKQVVGSGTYNISEDGKYFIQDKQRYKIVSFEKDEFAVKVESDLILHFKRVAENK
jgi:hypothetical protein